jgi:hypothetical protein
LDATCKSTSDRRDIDPKRSSADTAVEAAALGGLLFR